MNMKIDGPGQDPETIKINNLIGFNGKFWGYRLNLAVDQKDIKIAVKIPAGIDKAAVL